MIKKKEFNITDALSGEWTVVTEKGKVASEVVHLNTVAEDQCNLIVVINGEWWPYTIEGKTYTRLNYDLHLEREEPDVFINVYGVYKGEHKITGCCYPSMREAAHYRAPECIGTVTEDQFTEWVQSNDLLAPTKVANGKA